MKSNTVKNAGRVRRAAPLSAKAPAKKSEPVGQSSVEVTMTLEKETPGAIRYQEVDAKGGVVTMAEGAKIGTLYMRKVAFGKAVPKSISVTVNY